MITLKFFSSSLINSYKFIRLNILQKSRVRYSTVRRALLYVPGHDTRKIDKALSICVDCIAFDLGDLVPDDNKAAARQNITQMLNEGNVTSNDPEWCVRVNAIQTGREFLSDLDAILYSNKLPPAIALPGVDGCEHLQWFTEQLWNRIVKRTEEDRGPVNLLLVIGSAKGILRLPEICQKAQDLAAMAPIILSALVFDYNAIIDSLGSTQTTHGLEILYARQKLVLVAKAFGVQAIDMHNANPAVNKELENDCKESYIIGFTGKQVFYPGHIPVIQSEFCPSRSKIRRAQMLIKKFKKMEEENKGNNALEGIPMDQDALKVSEHVINMAKVSGKIV